MTDDIADAIEAVLGYAFRDRALLRRAFTHSSASLDNNDALACLGDRVYNVWVARRVYAMDPTASKGSLTHRMIELCRGETQALVLDELGLVEYLDVGGPITGAGGHISVNMRATVLEAIVAAIELDGGPDAAVAFLDRVLVRLKEVAQ